MVVCLVSVCTMVMMMVMCRVRDQARMREWVG